MLLVATLVGAYALIGFCTGFWVLVRSKINVRAWAHEPTEVIIPAAAVLWPITLTYMVALTGYNALDRKAEEIAQKYRK